MNAAGSPKRCQGISPWLPRLRGLGATQAMRPY